MCGYLVKVFLWATAWFGEVISEAVSGLGVEWQSRGWRGGSGLQHPDWGVKRLRRNTYCLPPTQFHFKTHYCFPCNTQTPELKGQNCPSTSFAGGSLMFHLHWFEDWGCLTVQRSQSTLCIFPCHESNKTPVCDSRSLLISARPHDLYTGQRTIFSKLLTEHLLCHLMRVKA